MIGDIDIPPAQSTPLDSYVFRNWYESVYSKLNGMFARKYLFANLPTSAEEGFQVWVINGRKNGEAAGLGTGVPAYWSNGLWRNFRDDNAVTV